MSVGSSSSSDSTIDPNRIISRRLSRLERSLSDTQTKIDGLTAHVDDPTLLDQFMERLADHKRELSTTHESIILADLEDGHELVKKHSALEEIQFKCSHRVKKLASDVAKGPSADGKGVRLPKLDVPTFDGDILNWSQFWSQFKISIHDRTHLSNSEKLVYLQQAVKDGSAKSVIEGLTRTDQSYKEAIDCLTARFNRPRLLHRAHVRKIVEAPPLKDGSGKELRRLHDTAQQHLRALKAMGSDPDSSFITSIIELKLDTSTMFEWQRHSQDKAEVPSYIEILEFLDLRAQASETSLYTSKKTLPKKSPTQVTTHMATGTSSSPSTCILCPNERHPLYACPKFKSMSHSEMMSTLKKNHLCNNCLNGKHIAKECKSSHRCKRCQRLHHTLLHIESNAGSTPPPVSSNTAVKLQSSQLLMTCRVLVKSRDGSFVEGRALLDNASSASFISERLVNTLQLPRSNHSIRISGIAGSSPPSPVQSIASVEIMSLYSPENKCIEFTAIVVPKVTCDLPVCPVSLGSSWNHIAGLHLADPSFGLPGRIDILLGVDIFVSTLRQGRRTGPPGAPVALETDFGWVLSGNTVLDSITENNETSNHVISYHSSVSLDVALQRFWEIEESPLTTQMLTTEEQIVLEHFHKHHHRDDKGTFVVPLPKKADCKSLGESRSQAVKRFLSLERTLRQRNKFDEFNAVMSEYFDLGHAEQVPLKALDKSPSETFYLPMHAVYKTSSSTTKVRAVFDASAKSSTGISLNEMLLVGPTVHSSITDVLIRFRINRIGLTADVSKMYRAISLVEGDRDLHRFVWRSSPDDNIIDYRMTRVTFGVAASSFAANMAVKQNSIDFCHLYPTAAKVVKDSFYVDDCLSGADSIQATIDLQKELQELFSRGGFLLRKWNSNESQVLNHLSSDLVENTSVHSISDVDTHSKTLGLEWNTHTDSFKIAVPQFHSEEVMTKRILVSNVAKIFDVLGWFSPAIISMKILLQRVWEIHIDWDDPIPKDIQERWIQWRSEVNSLYAKSISRCYFPKNYVFKNIQLHAFSDASENAYSGVVYIRMTDESDNVHVSLVMSKTRVAPIKRLSIPRLELCGAQVAARLLVYNYNYMLIRLSLGQIALLFSTGFREVLGDLKLMLATECLQS